MKIKLSAIALFFLIGASTANAQHLKVRIGFPAGISIGAVGPLPYSNAMWIGPEWQWRGGRYVSVPGYWSRPHHYGAVWIPGQWKYSRRGYRWVPGHWR